MRDEPQRLTLAECRRLIGDEHPVEDGELLALRDQLYALAGAAIAAYRTRDVPSFEGLLEAERLEAEERAAIVEFDGKTPRAHAERIALAAYRRQ